MNDLQSALLKSGDKQALVTTLATAAGIAIPPAYLPAVTAHLVVAAAMAQQLFATGPEAEHAVPAPVFTLPVTLQPYLATLTPAR